MASGMQKAVGAALLWLMLPALFACDDLAAMRNAPDPGDEDRPATDGDLGETDEGDLDSDGASTDDTRALRLDEALPEGAVRAGQLAENELGACASRNPLLLQGTTGDFRLYNRKVGFVVSGAGAKRLLTPGPGALRDASVLDAQGCPLGDDHLLEAAPIVAYSPQFLPHDGTLRHFVAESIALVHNGSDGRPARVRIVGTDGPFAPLDNQLLGGDNPMYNPKYKLTLDYSLAADADSLRLDLRAELEDGADATLVEVARVGLAVLEDGEPLRVVAGQAPEESAWFARAEALSLQTTAWAALWGPAQTLGFFEAGGKDLALMPVTGRLGVVMHGQDIRVKSGEPGEQGFNVYAGAGGPEALRASLNAGLATPVRRATITGGLPLSSELKGTVTVYAYRQVTTTSGSTTVTKSLLEALTAPDDAGAFTLALPTGTYRVLARNAFGEEGAASELVVAEEPADQSLSLAAPSTPAVFTLSVTETREVNGTTQELPLAARVDVYDGEVIMGATPLLTRFSDNYPTDRASLTMAVPVNQLAQDAAKRISVVVSRGFFYSPKVLKIDVKAGSNNEAQHVTLTRAVEAAYLRDVGTSFAINTTLHPFIAGGESALGPLGLPTPSVRLKNLAAEGIELFVAADSHALADYAPALADLKLGATMHPLSALSGMKVETAHAQLRAYGAAKNGVRADYFGLPLASYTADGSYSGKRATQTFVEELKRETSYGADLVELGRTRAASGTGFMDYIGYDPRVGVGALSKEGRDTLDAIDLFEVFDGRVDFIHTYAALQDWFSLIMQGRYKPATGHGDIPWLRGEAQQRAGYPQTLLYLEGDAINASNQEAALAAIKAGRMLVSGGPIVHLSVKGILPGGTYEGAADPDATLGNLALDLRVDGADNVSASNVYLCVNGTAVYYVYVEFSTETGRYDGVARVPLPRKVAGDTSSPYADSWIVAIAAGNPGDSMTPNFPNQPPFAITNPIFVEADGQAGLTLTPPAATDKPLCMNEKLCDFFANYDRSRSVAATLTQCCGLYPTKEYCQP